MQTTSSYLWGSLWHNKYWHRLPKCPEQATNSIDAFWRAWLTFYYVDIVLETFSFTNTSMHISSFLLCLHKSLFKLREFSMPLWDIRFIGKKLFWNFQISEKLKFFWIVLNWSFSDLIFLQMHFQWAPTELQVYWRLFFVSLLYAVVHRVRVQESHRVFFIIETTDREINNNERKRCGEV